MLLLLGHRTPLSHRQRLLLLEHRFALFADACVYVHNDECQSP